MTFDIEKISLGCKLNRPLDFHFLTFFNRPIMPLELIMNQILLLIVTKLFQMSPQINYRQIFDEPNVPSGMNLAFLYQKLYQT